MDFNATIDLIIKDLKEAGDIIDDLKKYPGIPLLQVEMAKLKCKSAAEVIAMLKTMKEYPYLGEKDTLPQKSVPKQLPHVEDIELSDTDIITDAAREPAEKVPAETESTPVMKEPEPKKIPKKDQESSILADQFSHLSGSFNEQMGTMKGEDDIADILKTKPLSSLLDAIGVNDKFLFIREIFNGNLNDYSQAISRLESAQNITDARAVIMSYTGDNNENEAVKQLLDLVKRKFPLNE